MYATTRVDKRKTIRLTQKDKQKNTPGVDLGGDGWVGGSGHPPPPWKLNLLNSHDKITKNN